VTTSESSLLYVFFFGFLVCDLEGERREEGKWEMETGEDMRVWGDGWKGKGKGTLNFPVNDISQAH
jgi:hypothetical protein